MFLTLVLDFRVFSKRCKKRCFTFLISYCRTMVIKLMVILSCDLRSNLSMSEAQPNWSIEVKN